MDIRTAGSLLPTLARSIARQPIRGRPSPIQSSLRQSSASLRHSLQQSRCLSSTPFRRQDQSSSASPTPSDQSFSKPPSEDTPRPVSTSTPTPTSSTNDFTSMTNKALDFLNKPGQSRPPTSTRSRSSLDDMRFGLDLGSFLDAKQRAPSNPEPIRMPEPLPAYGPSVGRTVMVDPNRGMDVGRAFRTLEITCARNRIRADFNRQRFHERPGLKRKRLTSERWRRRFKEGFRGMVKMVNSMKKQGW